MKKLILSLLIGMTLIGCNTKNPFFSEYENEYGIPPFEKIKTEHYLPAFKEGIKQQQADYEAIANNSEAPTFENTIEALELSGVLLEKVSSVFFNLYSAETNDELDTIANEVSPLLSEHSDNLFLNDKIFARVKSLYIDKENLSLNSEQNRILEKYYKNFVRSGANLNTEEKAKLREINKELSMAELTFGQNLLNDNNAYQHFVSDEAELDGLPESVKQAAAEAAKEAGQEGKWLFTTSKASFMPVLQYGENRQLRKDLLLAWANRGDNGNANDNKETIQKIMQLRIQRSNLLGYKTPAHFILEDKMAKTPEKVYEFLATVWQPALNQAKKEAYELQKLMDTEGKGERLEAWDWWYYTEKLRKAKYDLDEEAIRPYFKMENVRQGAFDLAGKLWGLQFTALTDYPKYHPDMEAFKVTNTDGSLVGVLITDYFPRPGKRAGAWMNEYRKQHYRDGQNIRPVIVNVGNFTKPTSDKPSLLSMDDVQTLFHEFGHALHGLLAQSTYISLSGTSVVRDFVELPSQIMENWCFEPQVMKTYAKHYETDEVMPDELMEKIQKAGTFNQGFVMTELLSAAILDMDYHTLTNADNLDVNAFERVSMERMGMIPEIIVRYRSTNFNHVFSGGYAAGYYSYTWAEVLDADAYQAFVETGDIYNQEVATSFRKNILEKGDSEDAMALYLKFRGKDPDPSALLRNRGFIN
ncbi:MAG: M3 family metallopeptidase [Paludibacter sp.]|nr:M3 family metallopeptidase [Paludibacter sp.]MDD4199374.1 M3 family metallopeptidase [Paludibacter sp.]MDD4427060.1 M3 family metallopeptidase [Paludibacter sp.]